MSLKRALALLVAAVLVTVVAAPVSAASALSISTSGGAIYFPGENAVVYYTITANGALVNPDTATATLYLPNNANSFALTPVGVGTGVFYVNYTLPDTATAGFYAVVITASYQAGAYVGSAVSGFEVSQGIETMQNNILSAIGSLGEQISTAESNLLLAVGALNSSLANSFAASVASLNASLSHMQSELQSAISTSQSAMTSAASQATTSIQGAITSAQSALASPISDLSSSNTESFNNVINYQYYILALAAVVLILTIVLLALRRK